MTPLPDMLARIATLITAPILLVMIGFAPRSAQAMPVSELTRVAGLHENVIQGLGIVVGLSGTGDDAAGSLAVARPYRELLRNLGNPVENTAEIGENGAFAVVLVTLRMPRSGGTEGQRFDVSVDTLFDATSLGGGRLVSSLLRPPDQDAPDLPVLAVAEGAIQINGDDTTSGIVREGGMMIRDLRPELMNERGEITLYLAPPLDVHRNALAIADAINEPDGFESNGPPIARVDQSGAVIRVQVPPVDRADPASFIAAIRSIEIDDSLLHRPAVVVIDRLAGTIVATNTVTVDPVAVAAAGFGLELTPQAPPAGAPGDPAAAAPSGPWTAVGATEPGSRSEIRLQELLQALNRIQVPVDKQIGLVHSLRAAGALTARIVETR